MRAKLRFRAHTIVQAVLAFAGAVTLLSCATTPPSPPLSPNGDAGANGHPASASNGAFNAAVSPKGMRPLPPPPDPALWADIPRATPSSVSLAHPGGSVDDNHGSALVRLLEEPFGTLRDKDDQVRLELPDASHWKRVRYRSFDHLVGFRYGEKYHAVTVMVANDTRAGRTADSLACIRQMETIARPRLRALSVELGPIEETAMSWNDKRIIVHSVEGVVPWALKRIAFSAAWASYPAYDKACLIYGIGVKHDDKPELARLVRDHWIREAVPRVDTRTTTKPERKP